MVKLKCGWVSYVAASAVLTATTTRASATSALISPQVLQLQHTAATTKFIVLIVSLILSWFHVLL